MIIYKDWLRYKKQADERVKNILSETPTLNVAIMRDEWMESAFSFIAEEGCRKEVVLCDSTITFVYQKVQHSYGYTWKYDYSIPREPIDHKVYEHMANI